jgi:alpha-glucosidase
MMWLGDQLSSFDCDGLISAVVGAITAGFSGWALQHGDLGGFTQIDVTDPQVPGVVFLRDAELLTRWLEAGAFLFQMYRSHPGLLPNKSAQVWDGALVQYTKRLSALFRDLAPYRRALRAEYRATGLAPVRHGMIVFPEDSSWFNSTHKWYDVNHCGNGWEIGQQQFFLGDRVLVAPVFTPGDSYRPVYFPIGRWQHFWSDKVVQGPLYEEVYAPLGQPPAFFRVDGASVWTKFFTDLIGKYRPHSSAWHANAARAQLVV